MNEMNIFQQVFATVNPRTNELIHNENVSPNILPEKPIKRAKSPKSLIIKKQTTQRTASVKPAASSFRLERKNVAANNSIKLNSRTRSAEKKPENNKNQRLQDEEEEISKKIAADSEELNELKEKYEALQRQVEAEQSKLKELKNINSSLVSELNITEESIRVYQSKINTAQNDFDAKYQEREQFWQMKIASLNDELEKE